MPPVVAPGAATWQPPAAPVGAELELEAPPSASAFCAAAGTRAPLPPPERVPPPWPVPRFAYGGSQSICAGAGAGEPHAGTLPSTLMGPAQTLVTPWGCATQVQVDGQSVLVVHAITFARQDDVESVVVVHEGGGGDPSTVPIIATGPASNRMTGGAEGDPTEPPPEHAVTVSGTHVNPEPQSLSTLQGTS
jgi:hypothetical protein